MRFPSSTNAPAPFRALSALIVTVLVSAGLVVGLGVETASAAPDPVMALTATSNSSILAGQSATVTLSANNFSSGTDLYNLSFSEVLPAGVTYVAGSTAPASVPNPQIIIVVDSTGPPVVSHQVLIWSNVSDLIAGNKSGITFGVTADPTLFPVGSNYAGTANAYAQTNPRLLPKFDATGTAISSSYTNSDTSTPASTQISALKITKTQPNPESELMRGIHNQTTTYTIKVQETNQASSTGVTVVDYLPAQLEFLDCGAVDNSSAREYVGAASLTATPVPSNCLEPTSVDTVSNPSGYPAGVYTKVTWSLGTLAASATKTFTYAAGIPLKANTLTWSGATPTPASNHQASNLDNNTGASTRQINNGATYTNYALASGTYTGALASTVSTSTVTDTDTATVESDDLDVVETANTNVFASGGTVQYDLMIRTGEYASSSGMVVTDTLPNGICPNIPAGVPVTGTIPADCQTTGTVTGGTMTGVTVNADGTFTITFALSNPTQVPNTTTHIVYSAHMRSNYDGSLVAPTASGDSFSNHATIAGTSTAVAATGQTPSTQPVTDDSGTTQASSAPTISKKILPRTNVSSSANCEINSESYVDSTAPTPNFVAGDRVCFELTVNFSTTTDTRDANVTDFAPIGTTYEGYVLGTSGDGNTVPAGDVSAPTGGTVPTWALGHTVGSDPTHLFITKGQTLVMFVSAIVTAPGTSTTAVDITANLMKYSQRNTSNAVLALRDQINYGVAPAPTMSLAKTITKLNATVEPANTTTVTVHGTDVVDFSIVPTNTGTSAIGNDQTVNNVVVWDALPSPLNCATVTLISGSGVCTDNYSGLTGANAGLSAIVWTAASDIAAGASGTALTYRVTLPATALNVSTFYVNHSSIINFQIQNTAGTTETDFYPTNSLDASHATRWNTVSANSNAANLLTPNVVVAKTVTSPVLTNNSATQAVDGEFANYTYSVTIPAHTSIFNGVIGDKLPTGLVNISGTTTESDNLPVGSTTTYDSTNGFVSTFPTTYSNSTSTDQVFTVTLTNVQVSPTAANGGITNTATFDSKTAVGGTAMAQRTKTATLTVVSPAPTITKTVSAATANAGDTLTYTININNAAGAPTGFDTIVNDCLPNGLTFVADTSLSAGITRPTAPTAGTGVAGNGCAVNTTLIQYQVGNLVASTPLSIKFTATIDPAAAGAASYTNNANIITSTLSDGGLNPTTENVKTVAAAGAVTNVVGATVTKTTTQPKTTIGDSAPYTIKATIPANVNFYNASIIDTIPAGMTADQVTATVTCIDTITLATCTLPGGGSAMTTSGSKIGWYLGNLTSQADPRLITITYNATVKDVVGNVTGTNETNSAVISWNLTSGAAPANAGVAFSKSSTAATALTTVVQPSLSVVKTVSNAAPQPATVFNYTVTVTNSNGANASTAYNVQITDTPPTGVVVDPATISDGGTITGQTANGGGTITWNLANPILNAGNKALTYSAQLASSTTLTTAAALTNTATVKTYASLVTGGRTYTTSPPTSTSTVTPNFPSVTLQKTVTGSTTAYANNSFGWTFTMTNAVGAGTADTVIPTDTLPANWTYDANSAFVTAPDSTVTQIEPVVTTTAGVQTLVWPAIHTFAAGKKATITYTATPSSSAQTGHANPQVNKVTSVTTDLSGADHNATGSFNGAAATATAFIDNADVSIVKTVGDPLLAGTSTVKAWTIKVTNNGPDTAVGDFIVNDTPTLPAGVTITGASGTGWTCTVPDVNGAFSCDRTNTNDTLINGASFAVITVSANVTAGVADGTTVPNTSTVTDRTADGTPSNNTSSASATVTTSADLKIVKTTAGIIHAGQTATWNLAVTNLGPSVSHSPITVVDTLPSGLTNVVATGTGWTCDTTVAGQVTCTMGDLGVAVAPQITISGLVANSVTGTLTNSAVVTGTTTDPVNSNNSSSVTDTVDTSTTMTLQKTLTSGTMVPGTTSTYEFDVVNTGTADARAVKIVDVLPDGLTFVAGSTNAVAGNWNCTETSPTPSTVTCVLTGTLSAASGSNVDKVAFDVNIPSSLVGDVTNTGTVSSTNAPDAVASATGTPVGQDDLKIIKSHPAGAILAGDSVVYTLKASNLGPTDNTENIHVVDTLPTGMSATDVTAGSGWVCSISAEATTVTCDFAAGLTDGQNAPNIVITALVAANVQPSTLTNKAEISGSSTMTDTDLSNNIALDPTVITTTAAVTISKTGAATLVPGTNTNYVITINNAGPSDAANVTVTDTLPVGLSAVSISGTGWTCDVSTFSCTNTDLPVGTSTINVTALVDHSIATNTAITNDAVVGWSNSSGTFSNSASATGTADAIADLKLTKTAVSSTVNAGEQATFDLIVQNIGASDAVGDVVITDTLPAGMSYVGSTGTWDCVPEANVQIIDCTLQGHVGVTAGGTAAALSIIVQLDAADAAGTLTNTATVISGTTDADTSNNTATADVNVGQLADLSLTKTFTGTPRIGNVLRFSLQVHNNGPSNADNVQVTDTIPNGLDTIDFTNTDPAWTCVLGTADATGTPVTCTLSGVLDSNLDAPELAFYTTVEAGAYSTVTSPAQVTTSTPETTLANNVASVTITVPPMVKLNGTKTHIGGVQAGENAVYEITVTNTGLTEEPNNYTVTDTLPDTLTYVSSSGTGVTCTAVGQIVTCVFTDTLAINATAKVDLTVMVAKSATGNIVNTIAISTPDEQMVGAVVNAQDTASVLPPKLATTGTDLPIGLIIFLMVLAIITGIVLRFRFGKRKPNKI